MPDAHGTYLPAAGHDWALPLYDPIVSLIGGNPTREVLVGQAGLRPGHRVLEIGCGTGSLLVRIKRLHPDVEVVGLDPDARALARAKQKADRARVAIGLDRGFSAALPYAAASFDRVFSSFMFHHLHDDEKEQTLHEACRVLVPGGRLHLLDFAGTGSAPRGFLARHVHSSHHLGGNTEGRIIELMDRAGFVTPATIERGAIFFGQLHVAYYQASTPAGAGDEPAGDRPGVRPTRREIRT